MSVQPTAAATPDPAGNYLRAASEFNHAYAALVAGPGGIELADVPAIQGLLDSLARELTQVPHTEPLLGAINQSVAAFGAATSDADVVIAAFGLRQFVGAAADEVRDALRLPGRSTIDGIDEVV